MDFNHEPVLLKEVIEGLNIKEDGIYIDGTLGGAGHSKNIVKKLKNGLIIGIDQDLYALKAAKKNLEEYSDRVKLVHSNFEKIPEILDSLDIDKVDGILLDIGVSSHQLDEGKRGFSYHQDYPLDMRMNTENKFTAKDIVNNYSKKDLTRIFWEYGEEKWAERIADFIIKEREEKPINTTLELVEVIKKAIPAGVRRNMGHPARKTFQAIRIEVNRELDVLKSVIPSTIDRLNPEGRLCIITFHSLEDRIVKNSYRELYKNCICPPEIPICVCDKERKINIITRKPIEASKQELDKNKRARSAKLRIAEKL